MGFEPMREFSPPNRLAGGRTRPLCDPSCLLTRYDTKLKEGGQGGCLPPATEDSKLIWVSVLSRMAGVAAKGGGSEI